MRFDQATQAQSQALSHATQLESYVAERVRALRSARNWTLDQLAQASGVSRTMLWQIEQARSAPTIKVLARVADALDVAVSALIENNRRSSTHVLRKNEAKILQDANGRSESRALFPNAGVHGVEFYELRLQPDATELAEPYAPGARENLIVVQGRAEITVANERFALAAGDAIYFDADVAHAYRNCGEESVLIYLVVSHAGRVNLG